MTFKLPILRAMIFLSKKMLTIQICITVVTIYAIQRWSVLKKERADEMIGLSDLGCADMNNSQL